MLSFIYFVVFTSLSLLFFVFPSLGTLYISAMAVILMSVIMMSTKLTPPRERYDPLMSANGGTSYDLHEGVAFLPILMIFPYTFAAIYAPEAAILTVYAITIIANYVYPTAVYLIWRVSLYRDIRDKADVYGWEFSGNIFEFIFSGRHNVHNVTVRTPSRKYTLGLLGGVGAMCYVIGDGTVKARRVMPVTKKYAIKDFGGTEKTEVKLWGHGIFGNRTRPLPETDCTDDSYLLLVQPNAFVVSDGLLADVGETVCGMRVLNMDTGLKLVH